MDLVCHVLSVRGLGKSFDVCVREDLVSHVMCVSVQGPSNSHVMIVRGPGKSCDECV